MKRIKIPSIASIHLDVFSRCMTPAGYQALLKPQRLKETFSFLTEPLRYIILSSLFQQVYPVIIIRCKALVPVSNQRSQKTLKIHID